MKKIVDGKRYDTETATCVHTWSNGKGYGDFSYREKKLYITKKGAWFFKHSGGPMTDMAVSCGSNSTSGSTRIEAPVSPTDALNFLTTHGGTEEAEEYFGKEFEDA